MELVELNVLPNELFVAGVFGVPKAKELIQIILSEGVYSQGDVSDSISFQYDQLTAIEKVSLEVAALNGEQTAVDILISSSKQASLNDKMEIFPILATIDSSEVTDYLVGELFSNEVSDLPIPGGGGLREPDAWIAAKALSWKFGIEGAPVISMIEPYRQSKQSRIEDMRDWIRDRL